MVSRKESEQNETGMFTFRGGIEDRVSALEAIVNQKIVPYGDLTDLNNPQPISGIVFYGYSWSASNVPEQGRGYLINIARYYNEFIQLAFTMSNGNTYVRTYNGTWTAWKKISFTA